MFYSEHLDKMVANTQDIDWRKQVRALPDSMAAASCASASLALLPELPLQQLLLLAVVIERGKRRRAQAHGVDEEQIR
jgi:type III secretory pathway component EscV